MPQLQLSQQKLTEILQLALQWYIETSNRPEAVSVKERAYNSYKKIGEFAPEDSHCFEAEILKAIESLNEIEKAEFAAILWIGRGEYEGEDFEFAKKQALEKDLAPNYLAEKTPMAEYLALGLAKIFLKDRPVPVEVEPDDEP